MKHRAQVAAAAVVLSVSGLVLWRSRVTSPGVRGPVEVVRAPQVEPLGADRGQAGPRVDIVFALDTTSSMSGLIAGAKAKIWEIARRAQEGQPAPELRVGLVAYRDKGDQYVTNVLDLTADLDKVYATLTELRAEGGGDRPEHVIKGLDDAINRVSWATGSNGVKLVYLVGDAPPHLDYDEAPTLEVVLDRARQRGIRISAIRCGGDAQTLETWANIARRTDGEVSTIEQSGGVVAIATPFDGELARLNAELAATEVHWGSEGERRSAREDLNRNLAAPAVEQADRASFYASPTAPRSAPRKKDLAAASPADLPRVRDEELPAELRSMTPDERGRYVEAKRVRRDAILSQVREVSGKREEHLRTAAPNPAPTSFDGRVYDSLRKAGAKAGITYR
jgi:Mg-chelatase subunit ChlD